MTNRLPLSLSIPPSFFLSPLVPHLLACLVLGSGTKPVGPSFGCCYRSSSSSGLLLSAFLSCSPTAILCALAEQAGNSINNIQGEVMNVPELWKVLTNSVIKE